MSDLQVLDIFVAEGFVLTEFAAVVEVIRLANRINGSPIFKTFKEDGKGSGEMN